MRLEVTSWAREVKITSLQRVSEGGCAPLAFEDSEVCRGASKTALSVQKYFVPNWATVSTTCALSR